RPAAGGDHPRPRPAPADLLADLGVRALRPGAARLQLGAHRQGRRAEVAGAGLSTAPDPADVPGPPRAAPGTRRLPARSASSGRPPPVTEAGPPTAARAARAGAPAAVDPVARVVVDVPLAHLDRPFDYLVPAGLADSVLPGSRVRVRFAGQLVDAVVLERVAASGHDGRLAYVERSVSAEPVLSPAVATLARAVADRWAGSLTDVLRLALPPRHARVEKEPPPDPAPPPATRTGPGGWTAYRA